MNKLEHTYEKAQAWRKCEAKIALIEEEYEAKINQVYREHQAKIIQALIEYRAQAEQLENKKEL